MRVLLFVPCLTDQFSPRAAEATVALLEHLGCQVDYPEQQTCCGQAHRNSGYEKTAAELVRRMATIFSGEDPVVTPSGSCAAMLRRHALEIIPDDDPAREEVTSLASRTREIIEFIDEDLKIAPDQLVPDTGNAPCDVAWHPSCHLREIDRFDASGRYLEGIPGLTLRRLDREEQCCGFGGTFAIKFGKISGALAEDRCQALERAGTSTLLCNDTGCAINIAGRLRGFSGGMV
ncbi:MAG TPA: (Fe-S)-binding protein [Planctomycetes bacterium]|nr:(Fe-S)-binding protein [Planctomycetota bacterium]